MRRLARERAQLSKLRASIPCAQAPETIAERFTRILELKYLDDFDQMPPEPYDRPAGYARMRRILIEGGVDPDKPYS